MSFLRQVKFNHYFIFPSNVNDFFSSILVFPHIVGTCVLLLKYLYCYECITATVGVAPGKSEDNSMLVELRGPDPGVRVRQVRVLGGESSPAIDESSVPASAAAAAPPTECILPPIRGKLIKQRSALVVQHRECEQETLKVFRLITGQVRQ